MIRCTLAVVGGFVAMAVLVGVTTALAVRLMLPRMSPGAVARPTPAYVTVNLIYSGLFAAVGGYVAALLAGRAPVGHALALAAIVLVMSLVSMNVYTGQQPRWYQLALLVAMPVLVIGGGLLRAAVSSR